MFNKQFTNYFILFFIQENYFIKDQSRQPRGNLIKIYYNTLWKLKTNGLIETSKNTDTKTIKITICR